MKVQKIFSTDTEDKKISSLPSCPTSQALYGGMGYSSTDMKNAFDGLSLLIIERFNALLDDICAAPADSISSAIKTGIYAGHTLSQLFSDLQNGNAATYIKVNGNSLASELLTIKEAIRELGGDV
ncbi:MAG: hypothetical protein E7676_01580 [Ruminococcaceae bacterium]|nr:hypothetical protein [Oscillospiraceae bacterium]